MTAARPYRPSNGTEGEIFMSAWCGRCRHDRAHRNDPNDDPGCPIIGEAMAYDIDNLAYPTEWIQDEHGPRCTQFTAADAGIEALDPSAVVRPLL